MWAGHGIIRHIIVLCRSIRWREASVSLLADWPLYILSLGYSTWHLLFHRRRRHYPPPPPAIMQAGFDIVTVVFKAELPLIKRQAQSLARYLDPAFTGHIIVIVNDLAQGRMMWALRRHVLPAYGPWRDRVRFVPFFAIGHRLDPANGWIIQQALKLLISLHVARPFYVLLDAKNHLFRPARLTSFVTLDGKAIQPLSEQVPSLPDHWAAALRYFGFDVAAPPLLSCAPITPFVMHTQTVRDLVAFMEAKDGRSICSIFSGTRFLSEFLLYRVYLSMIAARGVAAPYVEGPLLSMTFWPCHSNVSTFIADAEADPDKLFFGVHRAAFKRLDPSEQAALNAFWHRHGLLV